jgi:glycosyltransferase involved in cell wall biosynthesis
MKLLMLNWKDMDNPSSGGAELLTEGILQELVKRGHTVTLFACAFKGCSAEEIKNGYKIIRKGSIYTVHFWAFIKWFTEFRKAEFDIVIDQIHGVPFLARLYVGNGRVRAFIHEVAGEIWSVMFPFPLSVVGPVLEKISLFFYRNTPFVTVSEATKKDLENYGISSSHIAIVPEAIQSAHPQNLPKEPDPTVIFVGRLAPMKRVELLLESVAEVKKNIPSVRLWLVGGGGESYVEMLRQHAQSLGVQAVFFGRVSDAEKNNLLERAHILASASIKEGFGLVVLEAGLFGVPSIVYNVKGFSEAVIHGQTGIICQENTPQSMAENIGKLLEDKKWYRQLSIGALNHSKNFTFTNAAAEFEKIIIHYSPRRQPWSENIHKSSV